MYSPNYENNILVCFVTKLTNDYDYRLIALAVDPENNFNFLYYNIEETDNDGALYIKTHTDISKKASLICYHNYGKFKCIIYNSGINIWSNQVIIDNYYTGEPSNFNIDYIEDNKEYLIYYNIIAIEEYI